MGFSWEGKKKGGIRPLAIIPLALLMVLSLSVLTTTNNNSLLRRRMLKQNVERHEVHKREQTQQADETQENVVMHFGGQNVEIHHLHEGEQQQEEKVGADETQENVAELQEVRKKEQQVQQQEQQVQKKEREQTVLQKEQEVLQREREQQQEEVGADETQENVANAETQEAETPEAETQEAETQEAETQEAETQEAETQEAETQEAETQEAETQEAETQEAETHDVQEKEQGQGQQEERVAVDESPKNENVDEKNPLWSSSNLRFLTFGSSRTYGAGLENRREDSFAALLNHAENKGIRGSTPEYPAMCLYSMIGDHQIYDVIIIEFLREHATGALADLGMRLRHRYPHAVIIFLDYWAPREFTYTPEDGKSLEQYHREHMNPDLGVDVFQGEVLDGTNAEDWLYTPYNATVVRQAADQNGGFVLHFPIPDENNSDHLIESMKQYSSLYLTDMTHFNKMGHGYVSDEILRLLREIGYENHRSVVGEFESQDHCEMWYNTGEISDFQSNMEMVEFELDDPNDSSTKYALEVKPRGENSGVTENIIDLYNPWGYQAHLYMSYMATGPNAEYPTALVQVFGPENRQTADWVLNTHVPGYTQERELHIVMHWKIGPVDPGNSVVHLHIIEEELKKKYESLRIVGMMLTPHQYSGGRVAADF